MPSPSVDQLPYLGPLLDHTEDAVVACDADWRVTVWNEGARRADLLNGRLEVHSEPGVGTSVRLETPLANATS